MMLKRTPSDNRMIHFKQINLHPFISWRFKKNPFLSHLDSSLKPRIINEKIYTAQGV